MFTTSSLSSIQQRLVLDAVDESIWYPAPQPLAVIRTEFVPVGVNLGLCFTVTITGFVTAVCYYRAADTMPSSGSMALWRIDTFNGTLLSRVDFTGHSGTGWKVVTLPEPIPVDASHGYTSHLWLPSDGTSVDTTYTEYYWADNRGHYSKPYSIVYGVVAAGNDDPRGFRRDNELILNGEFAWPFHGFSGNHYWIDVIVHGHPSPIPPDPPLVLKWPIPDGWPTEATTGPDPDTVFGEPILDRYFATAPDSIIENMDLRGGLTIGYSGVTVRNCKISSPDNYVVSVAIEANGTTIEDCFVDGVGRNNPGSNGISTGGGIGMTIQRCNIQRTSNAIAVFGNPSPLNITVRDNFIHHMRSTPGDPHYDPIQLDGGVENMLIDHNTLMNEQANTAVVMITTDLGGDNTNITISNNLLYGAGYCCYCVEDQFNWPDKRNINISYLNNLMQQGYYGYFEFIFSDDPPTRQGNQLHARWSLRQSPAGRLCHRANRAGELPWSGVGCYWVDPVCDCGERRAHARHGLPDFEGRTDHGH